MKLGIFGGAFDPIHLGHLLLAEQCREHCGLDEVWFVPTGQPAHRSTERLAPAERRGEMVTAAIGDNPAFRMCTLELERSETSYTVDTLAEIRRLHPTAELFLLMSTEWLVRLPTWRDPERLADLARIVAVNRGETPLPTRDELAAILSPHVLARVEQLSSPAIGISASDIRRRVRQGQSIRYLVPDAVRILIARHGLYASDVR